MEANDPRACQIFVIPLYTSMGAIDPWGVTSLDTRSFMLPWQPEFQSNLSKTLMQAFPLTDLALHEIKLHLAN